MKALALGLSAWLIADVSVGAALAQTYYGSQNPRHPPRGYYGSPPPVNPPPEWLAEGRSLAAWDRYRHDYSGTRGRMGLGANPMHPEGPGNFSGPVR